MAELDLGCGKNKHPGAIGLDINPDFGDVVFEIVGRNNLPFKDNSFSKIYMIHFIEHISEIPWLLSEVHRVAESNAKVEVQYPHYSERSVYSDVTHLHRLGLHALDHFDPSTELGEKLQYYTLYGRYFPYRIENIEVDFPFSESKKGRLSRVIYQKFGMDMYETYFAMFLPILNVNLKLRVIK